MTACGGGGTSPFTPPPSSPTVTSVTITPNAAAPIVGTTQQFTANVQGTGTFSSAVTWMVNNIAGGNSTVGTISSAGLYTAPAGLPSPATVTIQAVSVEDSAKSGTASLTVSPENVQIAISPSSASVQLGATQKLNISVTGTANLSYSLTINGQTLNAFSPWGTLDSTGLYTAPTVLPSASVVTITATSLEDTTKSASASITILATAGGIGVSISPQNSTVVFDGSQSVQFNATVTGTTNTAVNWTVTDKYGNAFGQITPAGLFTPPPQDCNSNNLTGVVRATSVANSGAQATSSISLVPPPPVITALSPQPAPAEATLQVTGSFPANGTTTVNYPAPNGATITGGSLIPLGSSSGSLSVQVACGQFPAMTSNSLAFARQPRLRIRTDKKDLAIGESVQLRAAFLGDPTPQPINWGAGISSTGVYTATSQMGPDTFVPLSACIQNTNICDSVTVRVNPMAIEPVAPAVASGGTLQLSAKSGGGPVSATWSILAGGGSLLSDGTFTASTLLQDDGPVLVSASSGANTTMASLAVTGNQPGLVNRINDYLSYNNPTPPVGTLTKSIAVDGHYAYVLSVDTLPIWAVSKECWIDAYDITDPNHPVWIDAAEALNTEPSTATCSAQLYAYNNVLYEFLGGNITTYSVINGKLQLQQVWSVTGNVFDFLDKPFFSKGVFYTLPAATNPAVNGGPISVLVFDFTTGALVQRSVSLPLPQPGVPAMISFPAGVSNLLYILVGQPTLSAGIAKLVTYDISTNPPALVSTADALVGAPTGTGSVPKIFGTTLYDAWDVFDISGTVPVRIGTTGVNFTDVNPQTSLGLYGALPVAVADISNPSSPKTTATLDDSGGSYFAGDPVWSGNVFYQTETTGGWGIFSVGAPGGQILQNKLPDNATVGIMYDELVNGKYLYTAEQSDSNWVNIYDLSLSPPGLVGYYTDPNWEPLAVAVTGNTLYVGAPEGVYVFDVSSPASPNKLAVLPIPVSCLVISGHTMYAGTTDHRLVVLDVTNPNSPSQINQISLPDFPLKMTAAGNLLLIADNAAGLLTFSIALPATPVALSQYQPQGSTETTSVGVDGTLALVAAADGGFVILDISNPSAPVLLKQLDIASVACMSTCDLAAGPPAAVSIGLNNGIAYVGTTHTIYGMVFGFDYKVPGHPRLVSSMGYGGALEEGVDTLAFYQNQMFVGGQIGAAAAKQVDISQPRNVINLYYPGTANGSGQLSRTGAGRHTAAIHPKLRLLARRARMP